MDSPNHPDFGTPELQRRGITIAGPKDKQSEQSAQVTHHRRIDTMHRRGNITDEQYAAARRFMQDAFYAGIEPTTRSSINLEVTGKGGIDARLDAKDRYYGAEKALKGYERSVVMWVVIDNRTLSDISVLRKFQEEAMDIFKDALDKLAIFYGIMTKKNHHTIR